MTKEPTNLTIAVLERIKEKHLAAQSFFISDLIELMEVDFDDGKLPLTPEIWGVQFTQFPWDECRSIAETLLERGFILNYQDFDGCWSYVPDDKTKPSPADIVDSENGKEIHEVTKAAAGNTCNCNSPYEHDFREWDKEDILSLIEESGPQTIDSLFKFFESERTDEYLKSVVGEMVSDGGVVRYEGDNIVLNCSKFPQPVITAELIHKYLKNKGGRATLKQIQSRFKGYADNICGKISSLIAYSDCNILIDVNYKRVSDSVAYIPESAPKRPYFSAAADGKGGLTVLDRYGNPVMPRE